MPALSQVEGPAPPDGRAAEPAAGAYATVLCWIDAELHMLLQAESRDAANRPLRTLWIKSLKKVDNRWMVKDLEVQQNPVLHRTKLTVRDVKVNGQPATSDGGNNEDASEPLSVEGGSL
jgi:hypothetical protein